MSPADATGPVFENHADRSHSIMIVRICLLLFIFNVSCEVNKTKGKKRPDHQDKTLWKKEYEEELTDAMLATKMKGNRTRKQQALTENEAVIEKLMDTITASEKYLKKVDSIDFRLNRLDIEVHEKTNSIVKHIKELTNTIKTYTPGTSALKLEDLKSEINTLRMSLDDSKTFRTSGAGQDNALEARLTDIESNVRNIMSGVENILGTMAQVKNRQNTRTGDSSISGGGSGGVFESLSLINEFRRSLSEMRSSKKCDSCKSIGRVDRSERYPTDCQEIQMQGFNVSGIYKIRPEDTDSFYVLCDLSTMGGGWTVFQNRMDGSQEFFKSWSDYKNGFGNLAGEFWLGLDKLYYLTNQKLYELRVEIETQTGQEAYAGYSVFTIGAEHEGYRISTLGSFYGTAGDSLSYHAGMKFSTFDVDNDEWKDGGCAMEHGGAWWYKECDKSNLNGKYVTVNDPARAQSIYWISFKGPTHPIGKTKMMIRPLPAASKPTDAQYLPSWDSPDRSLSNSRISFRGVREQPADAVAVTMDQRRTVRSSLDDVTPRSGNHDHSDLGFTKLERHITSDVDSIHNTYADRPSL